MSIEPMKMKLMAEAMRPKALDTRAEVLETLRYFVDSDEFTETPEGLKIDYAEFNPIDYERQKDTLASSALTYRGNIIKMIVTNSGNIMFQSFKPKGVKDFRSLLKKAMDEHTKEFRSLNPEMLSKKAVELGKRVLENRDMRGEIAKYLGREDEYNLKTLTDERDKTAEGAVKIEMARRGAMKNKALEEFTKAMINNEGLACLFSPDACYKLNKGQKATDSGYIFTGQINIVPGYWETHFADPDTMGAVVYSDRENYYMNEEGDRIDLDEASKPFDDLKLGFYHTIASRKELRDADLQESLNFYEEMLEENDEPKSKSYWVEVGGYYGDAPFQNDDDDRKFYLIYLKKKFNITLDDINAMIKKRKDMIKGEEQERVKHKEEKKEKKTAKRKELETKVAENATGKGLPKGKANAIVLTWKEIKKKFPEYKKTDKYDDDKKFKVWLARVNYHIEPV